MKQHKFVEKWEKRLRGDVDDIIFLFEFLFPSSYTFLLFNRLYLVVEYEYDFVFLLSFWVFSLFLFLCFWINTEG